MKPVAAAMLIAVPATFIVVEDAQAELDEFEPIVEINATDGDVGFHALLDGDGWFVASIFDPDFNRLLKARASNELRDQGVTELFMESAEPLCWMDPEADPDDEVVTVDDFVARFEEGRYQARAYTNDFDLLFKSALLTHDLPAAPDFDEEDVTLVMNGDVVESLTLSWGPGTDLGNCAFTPGVIPDPATVEVERWEVVVEPDEDQLDMLDDLPDGVYSVQVPGDVMQVSVPVEWVQAYVDAGITIFKGEIGAKEESGNQTFTEIEFAIEP